MLEYQIISINSEMILKDIRNHVMTPSEIRKRGEKFLDELTQSSFEVLKSLKIIHGLPTQLLVGGENARPIKDRVYKMAIDAGIGDYVGNGEYFSQ